MRPWIRLQYIQEDSGIEKADPLERSNSNNNLQLMKRNGIEEPPNVSSC